jgi:hypothetical protein
MSELVSSINPMARASPPAAMIKWCASGKRRASLQIKDSKCESSLILYEQEQPFFTRFFYSPLKKSGGNPPWGAVGSGLTNFSKVEDDSYF